MSHSLIIVFHGMRLLPPVGAMGLGTVQLKCPQGIYGVEDARDTRKWLDTQEFMKEWGSRKEHCQTQSKRGPQGSCQV